MPAQANSRLFLLLFLATLAAFGPFVTDFYLPTLPEQSEDFHAAPSLVQLGLSTTMWGLAAGQLLVGPLSDRTGRKRPLAWCLLLFALSTFGAAAAPSIEIFLGMRFLEGLGASGAIVMSRSVAADRYSGRELGSFMGVMGSIQGIAPICAPMLGALIAEAVGWRGIFWLLFGAGVVLLLLTVFVLVETLPRTGAEKRAPRESLKESSRILFSDPVFIAIVIQQFLAAAILFGHISSSPFIFRGFFGLSSEAYGIAFGGMALSITVGAAVSGRLSDPIRALNIGAFGMLGGSLLLAGAFAAGLPLRCVVPCYVIVLVSLGLTFPASMTAALSLHRSRAGFAAAILGSISFVGGGLIAPFTAMGDARLCLSAIFVISGILLVALSFWLGRKLKLEHGHQVDLDKYKKKDPEKTAEKPAETPAETGKEA
ncbi:multidrug effflux MFS transporter [Sutterella sp.]|uniref:multidrug effflux MFS transporter n=1 Tax=Sutterella sp. TaxID=1981025 RepID=UPI0026E09F54|nr:multidrug effflux MFS transporter [Sutterella sp.]MDO5531154.1 multidrug effflux MFS transporter [Sutterella sp.]